MYMYCASMLFDGTVTFMKIAYNNDLRGLLILPKYNSASEMFVNLNILSFGRHIAKICF